MPYSVPQIVTMKQSAACTSLDRGTVYAVLEELERLTRERERMKQLLGELRPDVASLRQTLTEMARLTV